MFYKAAKVDECHFKHKLDTVNYMAVESHRVTTNARLAMSICEAIQMTKTNRQMIDLFQSSKLKNIFVFKSAM